MSHRDHHRDAGYFQAYRKETEAVISLFEERNGAFDQYRALTKRLNLVSASYSMGSDASQVFQLVKDLYQKIPEESFAEHILPLGSTIPLSALGQIFEIPDRKDKLFEYMVLPAGESERSRIVDLFLGHEPAWDSSQYQGRDIPKTVSKHFWAAADAARAGSPEASDLLVSFVRTHWYRSWRGAGWWGSHENKVHDVYSGYWCFEGAALAKMFNLDDSPLRNHKYYPYDLIHP